MSSTQSGLVYRTGPFSTIPEYDPETSAHYWVVNMAYRITEPGRVSGGPMLMDRENLVAATPIICVHCEKVWTRELAADPCEGDPA